jgi:hypothetical protein
MAQNDEKGVSYWLTHPGAATAAIATAAVSSVDLLDPLLTFATASVETWFPLLSTLTSVADMVPALPAETFETLFLIGALAYAAILVADLIEKW